MRDLIDGLRVWKVPVRVTFTAVAYVLATDVGMARAAGVKLDPKSLFDFDTECVAVSDEQTSEIVDIENATVLDDGTQLTEPKPMMEKDYDPEHHPDFDEDIHCVPQEYDEEGHPKGEDEGPLRS